MAKQKNKAYTLNREKYKAIKKYDHQQLEDFCSMVYESGVKYGYEAGCKAAAESFQRNSGRLRSRKYWQQPQR